jgi:hypothetical protein
MAFGQQVDLATLLRRLEDLEAKHQKETADLRAAIEALRQESEDKPGAETPAEGETPGAEDEGIAAPGGSWRDRLSIYGYWDAVLGHNRYDSHTWGLDAYHTQTFFSYRPQDNVRILLDVTYEHGPEHTKSNIGDIKIRSFAEVDFSDAAKLVVGKFLTPFGEYNLYHDAAVVFTSVNAPRSIYWKRVVGMSDTGAPVTDRFFAKEGAGIWALGTVPLSEKYSLEYNAYIINGRGDGSIFQVDDNDDKGMGTKLVVNDIDGNNLGLSFYRDRHGKIVTEPRTWAMAVQARYGLRPFLFSAEYARAKLAGTHATAFYVQGEYTAGQWTPYYRFDSYEDNGVLNPDEQIHTIGVNWAWADNLRLKVEHGFYVGMDDVFQAQLAAAF